MSLMSSLIPMIVGQLSLRSPIIGSYRPPHPKLSQLFLSKNPYKYKLMSIVEWVTIEVLLRCWIDHLDQAIVEHGEKSWILWGLSVCLVDMLVETKEMVVKFSIHL